MKQYIHEAVTKALTNHQACSNLNLTKEVINFVSGFKTLEEFFRAGGLSVEMLDRLAFGFCDTDITSLPVKQLKIKWKEDWENVKWEVKKSGLLPKEWSKKINLLEPIDVVYENNNFYVDDGHHRLFAAKVLGVDLPIKLEIHQSPTTSMGFDSYDTLIKCVFDKVKNGMINEVKITPELLGDSVVAVLSPGPIINLFDVVNNEPLGYINVYNNEVTGVAAKKGYGPLLYELAMAIVYPNALQSDRRGNTSEEAKSVWDKFITGMSPNIKVVKLSPNDKGYMSVWGGGSYEGEKMSPKDLENMAFMNYKFYNSDKSVLTKLLVAGNKLSDLDKNIIIKKCKDFYDTLVH